MHIPPYGSLLPEDYQRLGFKSGLEVHQQLHTRYKLFCRCPARRYSYEYNAEILRHMRPTLSEFGEYDGTALMEFKTRKDIIYRLNRDTVCTYEMDDAPPFGLDLEALGHALEIALLLRCNIAGELHITRKQYLDGSIPTGFQRTTIIGTDGFILLGGRRIGIRQLALEEDSCREVSDQGHIRTYLTDRLSTPLVEVVTEPELYTPEEVAEANQVIRLLNRCSGRVRTGYGAARQDVNVSITGGTRAEIKGVPRIPLIPALVHYEAFRQKALLDLRADLRARGLTPESFEPQLKDVTRAVSRVAYGPIRQAIDAGARVKAIVLPGFNDSLNWVTQPGRPFASEVSDRVRVIACLDTLPNLVYRYMADPSLDPSIWSRVVTNTRANEQDGIVLVWGDEMDSRTAAEEVVIRCREALVGVPSETRQVLGDGVAGLTGFERILPGPDRMYPDTDLPPIPIGEELLSAARSRPSDPPWELERRYSDLGLPTEWMRALLVSPRRVLFERLLAITDLSPRLVAELISGQMHGLRRPEGLLTDRLEDDLLTELCQSLASGRLHREALPALVAHLADQPSKGAELAARPGAPVTSSADPAELASKQPPAKRAVQRAILALDLEPLDATTVRELVGEHLAELATLDLPPGPRRRRFLMGQLMARLRGRHPGRQVEELLEELERQPEREDQTHTDEVQA